MILTGPELSSAVADGDIVIEPFDASLVNPNSYNYRLGDEIKILTDPVQDPMAPASFKSFALSDSGFVFHPGRVYLGVTKEVIGSYKYVPSLIGRSSIGRLGVFVQISADLGNLGAVHRWTLEIVVCQPVRLYPGMRFGQVSFWEPLGDITKYRGTLGGISEAQESIPAAFQAAQHAGYVSS